MEESVNFRIFAKQNADRMEIEELLKRIQNIERLGELETRPAPEQDSEMTIQQLREDNQFLRGMLRDLQAQLEESNAVNRRNSEQLDRLYKLVESQSEQLKASQEEKKQFLVIIEKLESQLAIGKKMHFGSKSMKGTHKKPESHGKDDGKDDFDGTSGSLTQEIEEEEPEQESSTKARSSDRKGTKYSKLEADAKVTHECDRSKIPADALIIGTEIRKVFDQINLIIEHDFEYVTFRTKEGRLETHYYPMADDRQATIINRIVPGTHVTAGMLSQLAFDCYQMSTPVNREMSRMTDMRLKTCRQTLINWLWKGGEKLGRLIPALKNIALEEGANTNCDETWVRVKTAKRYKKHYIWCLANKAQKTVIFFYDQGSRSRDTLKDFLGDSRIKSLQTDGYNVYTYLDKENALVNIEHICCWAHTRQKFHLALEQGSDRLAQAFLDLIGQLYGLEDKYKAEGLTAEQIKERRNNAETSGIIAKLASLLNDMNGIKDRLGYQMKMAVNYMQSFWKQLMAWRHDGNYSIDNNIAERSIRPITLQRKSSLLFGSSKGVEISTIYHTIIETCRLQGISPRKYLERFFLETGNGREDYENLLPMTIGMV